MLDVVAYAGYGFAGTSIAMLARIFWSYLYYFILPWFCICTGVFLVKTMKRVLQDAGLLHPFIGLLIVFNFFFTILSLDKCFGRNAYS